MLHCNENFRTFDVQNAAAADVCRAMEGGHSWASPHFLVW